MIDIVNVLAGKPGFCAMGGVSSERITLAEKALQLTFAKDYSAYLLAYGTACYEGHELTGICAAQRLNVVDVTTKERAGNPLASLNLYVIEQANIDGIVIWQSPSGEVYQSVPCHPPVKICHSLIEYIQNR